MVQRERKRRTPRPSSWLGKAGLVIAVMPWLFHILFQFYPPC